MNSHWKYIFVDYWTQIACQTILISVIFIWSQSTTYLEKKWRWFHLAKENERTLRNETYTMCESTRHEQFMENTNQLEFSLSMISNVFLNWNGDRKKIMPTEIKL